MLTPEQKRNIPTALTDKYEELTEFILRDLARRIADGAKLTDTAEYQLYRAKALGLSEKEIAAKVAEINGLAAETIEELIYSAAAAADRNDREHLGASDSVEIKSSSPLYKLLKAQVAYTCSECENLTNTLGFADHNADGTVCYRSLTDMYRRQMDMAQLKVMNGVTDYTTALRQAVNKLAASGVRSIDYESGCSRTVEAATRNALMTSISQVTNKISEQNAEEFGADGWEMSAHAGARPSHAIYQGRQYTQKEYEQKIRGLVNEYGCRHDVYPIILGASSPVYTEEELKNIDPPPFTYEGKRYTAYEAQQQMRKMERAMRKQKNRCIVADAAGDKEGFATASIKLRRQKDIYEDFCRKAGSFTQYERTIVGGYDRHLSGKTGAVTRKARAFDRAQIRLTDLPNNDTIGIEIDEFVPCLKDARTGQVLETEISAMKRNELKRYTVKNGWSDNWAKRPDDEEIFAVFIKGETEPQGLIALRYEKGGTYIGSTSTAPHNNKLIVGDNQKYIGVGGHLFALAVEQSLKNGGHGTIYGYAVNEDVLNHYIDKFGAIHIRHVHPYQFIIEGDAARNLLDTYNYERR